MAARGFKNGRQGLESGLLSLNKFFDPRTPSMRKGRDGGKKKNVGGKNGEKKRRKDG